MAINGFDFKQKYGHRFYKFIKSDMKHHQFTYKLGLNVDTVPFNPKSTCQAGGLYFTDFANLVFFQTFGSQIGIIEIPDDAQVYVEHQKFKADKFILHELIDIDNEKDLEKMINIESDFRSADYECNTLYNFNMHRQTPFAISCKQTLSKAFEKYDQQRKQQLQQQQRKQQYKQQREQHKQQREQQREQRKQQREQRKQRYKQENNNDENWPILDGWRDI